MSSFHRHPIGPKPPRGRPAADWIRCIACGLSTKTKSFVTCGMSNEPGGRLCGQCFSKVPEHCPADCNSWLYYLLPKKSCQSCSTYSDQLVICELCDRDICASCSVPETYETFMGFGIRGIVCLSCCPPSIRIRPNNNPNWCFLCCSEHSSGILPACQDPATLELPLLHQLREGRSRFSDSATSLAISQRLASRTVDRTPPPTQSLLPGSPRVAATNQIQTIDSSHGPSPIAVCISGSTTRNQSPLTPRQSHTKASLGNTISQHQVQPPSSAFFRPVRTIPLEPEVTNTPKLQSIKPTRPSNFQVLNGLKTPMLASSIEDRLAQIVQQAVLPLSDATCQNAAAIHDLRKQLQNTHQSKPNPKPQTLPGTANSSTAPNQSCTCRASAPDTHGEISTQWEESDQDEGKRCADRQRTLNFVSMSEIFEAHTAGLRSEFSAMKKELSSISTALRSGDNRISNNQPTQNYNNSRRRVRNKGKPQKSQNNGTV